MNDMRLSVQRRNLEHKVRGADLSAMDVVVERVRAQEML